MELQSTLENPTSSVLIEKQSDQQIGLFFEIHIIFVVKNINSISELQNCFKTTYEEGFVLLHFKLNDFIHFYIKV